MNKVILLLLIGIISFNAKAQTYSVMMEPDIKNNLNDVFFISANEGYFVGENSLVLHTTDGCNSFSTQTLPSAKTLKKVFFKDAQHGWIGASEGSVFSTTNGGATWREYNLGSLIFPQMAFGIFDAVYFTNNLNGYALAGKVKADYLFQTTDGGVNWFVKDSLVSATTSQRWYSVSFYDEKHGVIAGDKKNIQKYTTDGGNTWTLSNAITDNFFYIQHTVNFLSPTDVIIMGEGNEFNGVITPIYKSTDGGINWVKKPQNVTNYDRVKASYFKDAKNGIGVGSNGFGKMYYTITTDGGETWTPNAGNIDGAIQAVSGAGDDVYIIGGAGHIIKSSDFGKTWNIFYYKIPVALYGLQFIGTKGYAMNSYGDIFANNDGSGKSWKFISTSGIWDAYSMKFVNENTGFVLHTQGHIAKTTDGGQTWRTVASTSTFSAKSDAGSISFPSEKTGYAFYSLNDYTDYRVAKTTDGGDSWKEIYTVSGPGTLSGGIEFFDENTGIIASAKRWIMRTTNGGVSWDSVKVNGIPSAYASHDCMDLQIIDDNNAWVVGYGYICKSTDKGLTWNYINLGFNVTDSAFRKIIYKDANKICITSNGEVGYGSLYFTTDGGKSWSVDSTFSNKNLIYTGAYNSAGNIFLGTTKGSIISDGSPLAVKNQGSNTVKNFVLQQNYPNPFNPSTNIKFELKNSGHVTLKVFDIMGREVATLANGIFSAGVHNITFDASKAGRNVSISSGVYYYRLQTDNYSETKKMLLLR